MQRKRILTLFFTGGILVLLLLFLLFLTGCPTAHNFTLYLTSSMTGNVYTYDLSTNRCSNSPIFNYGTDAGDGIYFYYGRGYIASASFTNPGLVTFNPNEPAPVPSTISHSWVAGPWDIIAINRGKSYVTDVGNYNQNDGGVYYFNPEDTGSGFTKIAGSDANCQDMTCVAGKRKLYVANSGSDTVSVIDTASDIVIKEIDVEDNPTVILSLPDGSKIYVVCTNYFGKSSLVEITTDSDTRGRTFTIAESAQAASIYGTRIYYTGVQDPFGSPVDIGPFYFDVGVSTPSEIEITTIKAGGSYSLVHSGRLYITQPDWAGGLSTMTILDLNDNTEVEGSPFDVGTEGDGIKGMAVY